MSTITSKLAGFTSILSHRSLIASAALVVSTVAVPALNAQGWNIGNGVDDHRQPVATAARTGDHDHDRDRREAAQRAEQQRLEQQRLQQQRLEQQRRAEQQRLEQQRLQQQRLEQQRRAEQERERAHARNDRNDRDDRGGWQQGRNDGGWSH